LRSQRLAEDKQTGALELILSTPTTERTISRGLWMAYGRRMLFPVIRRGAGSFLVSLAVHDDVHFGSAGKNSAQRDRMAIVSGPRYWTSG
jgi:hypothetical protein